MKISQMMRTGEPATSKERADAKKAEGKKVRKSAVDLDRKMRETYNLLNQALDKLRKNTDDLDQLRSQAYKLLSPELQKKFTKQVSALEKLGKKGNGELAKVILGFLDASEMVGSLSVWLNEHVIYKKGLPNYSK